jgi:hypothetical protein
MSEPLSVHEILQGDIGKIVSIAEEVTDGARVVTESMEAMRPRRSDTKDLSLSVPAVAVDGLNRWAKTWRISREQLIRLCLHRVGEEFGFDVSKLLSDRDLVYTVRSDQVNKPFDTKEECLRRSEELSRGRVFTCESPRSRRLRCSSE